MPPPLGYAPPRVRAEPPTDDCADRKIPPRPLRTETRATGPPHPSSGRGSVLEPETRLWNRKIGHRWGLEQPAAGLGDPASPHGRAIDPGAGGGDPRVGVHLPVELGDQHEREPAAHRYEHPGAVPDRGQR